MKEVQTFIANIYLGFKYENDEDAEPTRNISPIRGVYSTCQRYCDEVGLCVTVSPTSFIYTKGCEDGCVVGLINYPRFPSTAEKITELAIKLAEILKQGFKQTRASVVTSDKTYMLE